MAVRYCVKPTILLVTLYTFWWCVNVEAFPTLTIPFPLSHFWNLDIERKRQEYFLNMNHMIPKKITNKKAMTTAFTSEFDCAQFTVGQYLYSWKVLIFIPTSFHQSPLHLNINKASWIKSRISLLWEKTRIFKKKCLTKLFYPNGTTLQFSYRVQLQVFEFRELGEVMHLGDIWGRDLKKPFN